MDPPRALDLGFWATAARIFPRLTDAEGWERLGPVGRWLITARSIAFVMTILATALAGVFAARDGAFHAGRWLLLFAGLIAAHATNNILNDLIDFRMGIDVPDYFRHDYASHPLQRRLITPQRAWAYAAGTGLAALAAGGYFVHLRGLPALALIGVGAVFVVFYTWPLKYIGLGEPVVLAVWGPLMVGGGHYVITGGFRWDVAVASLPYGLTAATVLFGKHIEKFAADRAKSIHTLPVLLGERASRHVSIGLMAAAYLGAFGGIAAGVYPPTALAVLLAIPI